MGPVGDPDPGTDARVDLAKWIRVRRAAEREQLLVDGSQDDRGSNRVASPIARDDGQPEAAVGFAYESTLLRHVRTRTNLTPRQIRTRTSDRSAFAISAR